MRTGTGRSRRRQRVVVAAVTIILASLVVWGSVVYIGAARDARLQAEVATLGGPEVDFAYDGVYVSVNDRGEGERLRKVLALTGERAVGLCAHGLGITDKGLAAIGALPHLKHLVFGFTSISDAGLRELAHLDSLEELKLAGANVSDAGLADLRGLRSLKYLVLASTHVVGFGLAKLADLPHLEGLWLEKCPVTDEGLRGVLTLKHLQVLSLPRTHITGKGIRSLAALASLETLVIYGNNASKEDIQALTPHLPHLKYLTLDDDKLEGELRREGNGGVRWFDPIPHGKGNGEQSNDRRRP
jgi:hypothetical protein